MSYYIRSTKNVVRNIADMEIVGNQTIKTLEEAKKEADEHVFFHPMGLAEVYRESASPRGREDRICLYRVKGKFA